MVAIVGCGTIITCRSRVGSCNVDFIWGGKQHLIGVGNDICCRMVIQC
jgi:hypothetical protein